MKQLLAALAVFSSAPVASASVIAYDGFDYTAGNVLRTNGGWVGSSTATPRPTVVAGSLNYPGLPASVGNSVQLTNANGTADRLSTGGSAITSGTLYYSMIVQTGSGGNVGGAFFAGFDDHSTGTLFTPAGGLYTRFDPVDNTKIDLGIRTGASDIGWSSSFTPGNTLFVVGSFTFNGVANLDVFNSPAPVPATEPAPGSHSASTLASDPLITQILAFYLRQNTGEPTPITVDELRIGTTWADVVPEPASLAALAPAALSLLAGRCRRQRRK
jgi:hypothetical protein